MTDESSNLRQMMRSWASGVTVVTARHKDQAHGMTVSAFTSISLEPPRVIVSLEKASRTTELAMKSGYFGITILAADQKEISDRFAGRIPAFNDNRFEGLEITLMASGCPFISRGLAFLDCAIVDTYESGTNTLLIGDVIATLHSGEGAPLLYFDQDYRSLK